jgi:hypothetical protein
MLRALKRFGEIKVDKSAFISPKYLTTKQDQINTIPVNPKNLGKISAKGAPS